jgi:hypothetical protein
LTDALDKTLEKREAILLLSEGGNNTVPRGFCDHQE